jgi:hypothetical protein
VRTHLDINQASKPTSRSHNGRGGREAQLPTESISLCAACSGRRRANARNTTPQSLKQLMR